MNRTRLIAVILALFTVSAAHAQVDVVPRFGVNASGLDAKLKDFTTEASTGWNAGLDLHLGRGMVFLQPGLHYYRFDADLTSDPTLEDALELKGRTTINQLKIPVNLGFRLTGEGGVLDIYATGGIVPTFLIGVRETDDFAFDESDISSTTWGASLGAGVNLLFLNLDVRYELGLSDFYTDSSAKNNVFTAAVGIRF